MLNEQTYQKLVTMRLHGLAEAFRQYMDGIPDDKLTFEERLGLMVDREYERRQEWRLKLRLAAAKLRERACLEDVNYRHPRNLDRSVVQRLATCHWVKQHANILITGATGLGKTWLACALANQACRNGSTVKYVRVPRILHEMQISRADGSYRKELAKLEKMDVLILDDWGLAPLGENERRDLLEIVEDRSNSRSTIVTSQIPVKNWHELIGDPTIADSILDRIVHNSYRIDLAGKESMRPQQIDQPEE
jgi:DNA replication protein DnaC